MQGIFDSHAHYDDKKFDGDRGALLRSMPENGVCRILNIGCDLTSSQQSIDLAEQYDFIYCAVGTHPHEAKMMSRFYLEIYREMAAHPKVKAIGEIGLDYHYDFSPRDIQKKVFDEQMALARELSLPVVIHEREALPDTLEILKRYPGAGVVHCFSGSAETAREILRLGYHVGFGGALTFKNARRALEAAAVLPLERILLETDCPYMAPEPHRGKRNDSTLLPLVAQKLAEIKGITAQEVVDATRENACRLFGIA